MSAISCEIDADAGRAWRSCSADETRQTAMLRRAGEEAAQHLPEIRLVQQEGVMAVVGDDLGEADIGGDGVQGVDDAPALDGRDRASRR